MDDSKVKSQDTSYVFYYIANSNPNGRRHAWNFLKSKLAQDCQEVSEAILSLMGYATSCPIILTLNASF